MNSNTAIKTTRYSTADDCLFDQNHIFHPYSAFSPNCQRPLVTEAHGATIKLKNGTELIDAMSSWWAVIHGYNHPVLNQAIFDQTRKMAHVMFGGLTHAPAIELCRLLIDITPESLNKVFLSDSGSVSVEVALKMATQYWIALKKPQKSRFLTFRGGYFGDTFKAMSLADPDNGMHAHFEQTLARQCFLPKPTGGYSSPISEQFVTLAEKQIESNKNTLAGIIVEPVVQGAGGMNIYNPDYLKLLRGLADKYELLLIFDEIATGFGRTGKRFAAEHACNVTPDLMTLGKALTGGYLTLAATIVTDKVASTIQEPPLGVFMHGPTFMANPLACAVATASTKLYLDSNYNERIQQLQSLLLQQLEPAKTYPQIKDVRALGAIGILETHKRINTDRAMTVAREHGVWIRPFRNMIYTMPPYIISDQQLTRITTAMLEIARQDIYHE